MTAQHQDIRRCLDGSIDIEFYRDRGLMERRAVMARFFRSAGKPLAAAFVLVALTAIAPRDMAAVDTAAARTSVTR